MKKILLISSLFFLSLSVQANGCELLGKIKPIGSQIFIKDEKGRNSEMLCAEVAELHTIKGKIRIKKTSPKWAKKITNVLGEDCWYSETIKDINDYASYYNVTSSHSSGIKFSMSTKTSN